MIVVANPSGGAGRSFKGLHEYCAHDPEHAQTSDRVDWMSTRNIAADPEHAYKVMIATAQHAEELKAQSGIAKTGRKASSGEVLHLVMSFDQDEPSDRDSIENAVDGLLSSLGADPDKMRGKSKPKRRQFADEHQAVLYVHKDTENTHVHIMVNTVHPETGLRLPTSNNYDKLQKWAGKFSAEHGTAHKTPARQENAEMRQQGEYVKHPDRQHRKAYEEERELKAASNDNDRVKAFVDAQKAKDAALFTKGRELAKTQAQRLNALEDALSERKAQADKAMRAKIGKAQAEIREAYRPKIRAMTERQSREMDTFNALETSFWGRAKNTAKAIKQAYQEEGGAIARSFRILSSSGERKAYLERAQHRERQSLDKAQAEELKAKTHEANAAKMADENAARRDYLKAHAEEKQQQAEENAAFKAEWKARQEERKAELDAFKTLEPHKHRARDPFGRAQFSSEFYDRLSDAMGLKERFDERRQQPDQSQDNARAQDDGQGQD